MRKLKTWPLVILLLLVSGIVACSDGDESQSDCSQANNAQLEVGDEAPDFRLQDHTGRYVRLSDMKDKSNVVIAFYPAAFTPV
jgi:cytochrome oxidase Cu insertion factor (SCO1/SenC/PrrC family)